MIATASATSTCGSRPRRPPDQSTGGGPGDELFLEFLRTAKARGFRVIIDGVFNHVNRAPTSASCF